MRESEPSGQVVLDDAHGRFLGARTRAVDADV